MSAPKSITLEIIGLDPAQAGYEASHSFDLRGGRFGRAEDNDWVIREDFVSRYQGSIGYANGAFHVSADPRANAPILLNASVPLVPPEKRPLVSGDRICIGKLVIRVGLVYDFGVKEVRAAPQPAAASNPASRARGPFSEIDPLEDDRPDAGLRAVELDVDALMGGGPAASERPKPNRSPEERASIMSDHAPAWPTPAPSPSPTPPSGSTASTAAHPVPEEDWYKRLTGQSGVSAGQAAAVEPVRTPAPVAPVPSPAAVHMPHPTPIGPSATPTPPPQPAAPQQSAAPSQPAAQSADLHAFLKGAGLDETTFDPQALETLGGMLRVVVEGVIDILRARNEIRREFRLPVTVAEAKENNPLKFSADAHDALYNMLVKRNPAYLKAVPAFEEAFDDLRQHQLAMLKGLRMAYAHMLSRFDPERLQQRFESQAKASSFAGLPGRPRPWEQYCAWFAEQSEDEDECFRRLFGEEFGKVYERERERLAHLARKARPHE